jgi:hypothetical protein
MANLLKYLFLRQSQNIPDTVSAIPNNLQKNNPKKTLNDSKMGIKGSP